MPLEPSEPLSMPLESSEPLSMPLESSEPCLCHWSRVSLHRCHPSQVSLVNGTQAKLGSLMASEPSEPSLMPLEPSEPLSMLQKEALVDLPKVMLKAFQKETRKSTAGPKRLSKFLFTMMGRDGYSSSWCIYCILKQSQWTAIHGDNDEGKCNCEANLWTIEKLHGVAMIQM
jgi:hypothetical protein